MGVVKGAIDYFAATKQADAAGEAANKAQTAGDEAQGYIEAAAPEAKAAIEQGYSQGRQDLLGADSILAQQAKTNEGLFAPERQVGQSALERLNQAILQGDQNAVQLDPGYQFRIAEGNKAIERAAAAAGSFGSGGNLKDFARFSQGIASDEYGKSINRLLQLQQIGSGATQGLASLNTGLAGNRANVYSSLSAGAINQGNALSALAQNTAIARANAKNRTATNVNNFQLQQANAIAQGTSAIGEGAAKTGRAATSLYGGGFFGGSEAASKGEVFRV